MTARCPDCGGPQWTEQGPAGATYSAPCDCWKTFRSSPQTPRTGGGGNAEPANDRREKAMTPPSIDILIERLELLANIWGPALPDNAAILRQAASALEEREGLREALTLAISRLEEADKAEWGDDADALSQEARSILEAALNPSPVEGTGCDD